MGVLKKIWLKRFKGGPMDRVGSARLTPDAGIEGNAECSRKRHVTAISAEGWRDAERQLGKPVEPTARRANLLLEGIDLVESLGKTLEVGEVKILIWGETRPCRRMEEACAGLQAALDPAWRAGAHGEIIAGGEIREGDAVVLSGAEPQ